ncbi:HAD-IIB family hydrolase [Sphingomonas sp. RHCKR47]|uniref:HAD-IIB family hydrolase n=1 Tax=Sphingomonas citricola TaxID=2862498 RepID=UPI001CA4C448|nr:HAD-IIB family hydrolase [Sphingomonas citricola]MBW6522738.1 HAD-IIB family hydrolase [Sphingomonas citricola]
MFILHLALGGCLKAPPIDFGITADSGGHLAYVLAAATMQATLPSTDQVVIVTRLFAEPHLSDEHALASQVIADGVTIARLATTNPGYLEKEALADELPSFMAAFRDYLRALPTLPDVIHAHFADAAAIAIDARAQFGIPVVYTPHALAIDKRAQGLDSAGLHARIEAERTAIAAVDALIVSSRDEAERQLPAYATSLGERVHLIAPGVPQRAVDTSGATRSTALAQSFDRPDLPIILAIARPVRKKNLAALIRAYAGDAALQRSANLIILAGQDDGHAGAEEHAVRAELRTLADAPALRGRIALPARHDEADVSALYRRAAAGGVFVNPALHEPFGLTVIEAAEAGVPVVATRNGGPVEIVDRIGHGILVDPRDDRAIAAACRAIIDDADAHARFAAAARANVGQYDWQRYAARSVEVYPHLRRRPALLACDIDGTLTGCVRGAAAFSRWRGDSALPFVVATGRSFDDARRVLADWDLPEPDAFITDVGTRIMLAGADGTWAPCSRYAATLDDGWDLRAIRAALVPLALRPQGAETASAHKLSFFGTAGDAAAIRDALEAADCAARVVFSHGTLIDVLPVNAGKAAAIAAYADRIGLTLADCVTAGDSGNDEDMLDASGSAIVVGNASDELAGLAARPGLHRARAHHAAGVMEGLARLGLAPQTEEVAA